MGELIVRGAPYFIGLGGDVMSLSFRDVEFYTRENPSSWRRLRVPV
jgi:hypothetical protein